MTTPATAKQTVLLAGGEEVHFDAVSLDIGSRTLGTNVKGVATFTVTTRPINGEC